MASLTERFVASIESASDLPSPSGVLRELIRTLDSARSTVPEITAIIRKDPVIVAQVLRAANAAAYAGHGPVASLHEALLRLGVARVRRIALLAGLYAFAPFRGPHVTFEAFWRHSLGVACTAQLVAERIAPSDEELAEVALVAGLLHDIALLVLQHHFPNDSLDARRLAEREGVPLPAAELALFGTDHGELGAIVARHWALPDALVEAIRGHHRLELAGPKHRRLASVIHLADAIWTAAEESCSDEGTASAGAVLCHELGLDPGAVPTIVDKAHAEAGRDALLLG